MERSKKQYPHTKEHWKDDLVSGRRAHRRLFTRRGLPAEQSFMLPFVLWGLFIGTWGYMMLFSPSVMVREISVGSGTVVNSQVLQSRVERILDEPHGRVIPGKNYFFLPLERLRQELLKSDPLLADVQVSRFFPDILTITFSERSQLFFYCQRSADETEQCFTLDQLTGAVGAQVADTAAEKRVPVYRIEAREPTQIASGMAVLAPQIMTHALDFIRGAETILGASFIPIFSIPTHFSEEIRVTSRAGTEYALAVSATTEQELSLLRAIYFKDVPRSRWDEVALVDLRTEGKAFYTVRGDAKSVSDGTPSTERDSLTGDNR